jgi:hypothetical protein
MRHCKKRSGEKRVAKDEEEVEGENAEGAETSRTRKQEGPQDRPLRYLRGKPELV